MECVRLESGTRLTRPTAVALGNFDGVHLGHCALAEALVRRAREADGEAVVLTFVPHPMRVLAPGQAPRTLMTVEQKAEALASLGVDRLVVAEFTRTLAALDADAFLSAILKTALNARVVVVGPAFRFGRDRAGDAALIERSGVRVESVPGVQLDGAPVSSTRVRESLAQGAVDAARRLLGRPFANDGRVVRGDGRGRGLGIPTANLDPANEVVPAEGVYAAWLSVRGASGSYDPARAAVVNVGRRPTFGGGEARIEAHVLDFSGDLYGRIVRIAYLEWLRGERRFADQNALLDQIRSDVTQARAVLEKR